MFKEENLSLLDILDSLICIPGKQYPSVNFKEAFLSGTNVHILFMVKE